MHELSLMQAALDAAIASTVRNGAKRIHHIRLRVGQMSGVVPEALASAFAVLSPGTPAAGATLDIDCVPTEPRPARLRHVLSNSYAFGGNNSSLILSSPAA